MATTAMRAQSRPGETHMIPWQNPELFNRTVETFFAKPCTKPDTRDILSAMMATN
jgi:hypothetical protein